MKFVGLPKAKCVFSAVSRQEDLANDVTLRNSGNLGRQMPLLSYVQNFLSYQVCISSSLCLSTLGPSSHLPSFPSSTPHHICFYLKSSSSPFLLNLFWFIFCHLFIHLFIFFFFLYFCTSISFLNYKIIKYLQKDLRSTRNTEKEKTEDTTKTLKLTKTH